MNFSGTQAGSVTRCLLLRSSQRCSGQGILGHQPAVWLWADPIPSLSLSCLIWKMRQLGIDLFEGSGNCRWFLHEKP